VGAWDTPSHLHTVAREDMALMVTCYLTQLVTLATPPPKTVSGSSLAAVISVQISFARNGCASSVYKSVFSDLETPLTPSCSVSTIRHDLARHHHPLSHPLSSTSRPLEDQGPKTLFGG
jgi:hypothetical protein